MSEIDSSAYKVLKKLNNTDNSRYFTPEETYWLSYLHVRNLVDHTHIKIAEHNSLDVYVINRAGKSAISDHCKATIKSWVVLVAAVVAAIIGLAALLLKL